jgi:hypothetical protein
MIRNGIQILHKYDEYGHFVNINAIVNSISYTIIIMDHSGIDASLLLRPLNIEVDII